MASIFAASGPTVPIGPGPINGPPAGAQDGAAAGSARAVSVTLPPIIHLPARLARGTPRLLLCYFLVQTNAQALDRILRDHPMPGTEVRYDEPG